MAKPRKTLSLKGITPEQEALITRQEVPRIERIQKEEQPKPDPVAEPVTKPPVDEPIVKEANPEVVKKVSEPPSPEKESDDSGDLQPAKKKKSRKKGLSKSPVSEEASEPWITKTYRLPGSLIDRLQWVSLSRRMNKVTPNTQQELLAQALTEWLEKNEE